MLCRRALAALLTALLTVVIVVVAGSTASAAGPDPGQRALLTRCVQSAFGTGRASAVPVAGSADAGLVSSLALLRRPRTAADAFPSGAIVRRVLAIGGATTYDPAATIRVSTSAKGTSVYAVPATVGFPALPGRCAALRQAKGLAAYIEFRDALTGAGPGVCLLTIAAPAGLPSGDTAQERATCESASVLGAYVGALGVAAGHTMRLALVPDGVTAITYTMANGRQISVPVANNVASTPFATGLKLRRTVAQLRAQFTANLPPAVTEVGVGGAPVATFARPPGLLHLAVSGFTFLENLLSVSSTTSESGGSRPQISCDASTHRCVTVTVSSTCSSNAPCHLGRTIRRYRSTGRNALSRHINPLLLAPIRTRLDGQVRDPHQPLLILTGAHDERVGVVMTVGCTSPSGVSGGSPGPLIVTSVPGRIRVPLPRLARKTSACGVAAFVTSSQPGTIHARLINH